MNTALTIAGSDSSGGAGIQADLKTMTANGVYGMSAITALTAQNTTGVTGIMDVTPEFLEKQIDAIFTDIFPDAVKTGMVSSTELIHVIADKLKQYNASNIVVDPVMVATSGAKLISDDAIETLKECLLPLATVITPNIPEAEVLSDMKIESEEDMEKAAKLIFEKFVISIFPNMLKYAVDIHYVYTQIVQVQHRLADIRNIRRGDSYFCSISRELTLPQRNVTHHILV